MRPEQVRLHRWGEAPAGAPCLDGVILDVTYLGHAFVYTVSVDAASGTSNDATTVTARVETGEAAQAAGEPVSVSWAPATTTVVAD